MSLAAVDHMLDELYRQVYEECYPPLTWADLIREKKLRGARRDLQEDARTPRNRKEG
jgi:hypothetical protein